VSFSWDGTTYEIDLSKKNIAEFAALLEPYVAAGRRVGGRGRRAGRPARVTRGGSSAPSGVDLAAVRTWAAANGHAVAARGRISATVLDAFQADTGTARATKAGPSARSRTKSGSTRKRIA
jgi:hypothetical protein